MPSMAIFRLNVGLTLYRSLVGFVLASVIGVALGVAMTRSRWARWFFDPIISVGFPMPKVVFLPVVILWLGVFDVSKIAMVTIEAVFPVVTATVLGVQGVGHELLWSARNMGANDRELLWQIVLPAAFPQIMTGIQVALPIALIVAVFTEMAMGGFGLGGAMMQSSRFAGIRAGSSPVSSRSRSSAIAWSRASRCCATICCSGTRRQWRQARCDGSVALSDGRGGYTFNAGLMEGVRHLSGLKRCRSVFQSSR